MYQQVERRRRLKRLPLPLRLTLVRLPQLPKKAEMRVARRRRRRRRPPSKRPPQSWIGQLAGLLLLMGKTGILSENV
jgi:hypothetical protein